MEYGKLTGAVLVGVVMIVIVMVVVIPVLDNASYNAFGNNTTDGYATELPDSATLVRSDGGYTWNGTAVAADVNTHIIVSDNFTVTLASNALQVKDTTTVANCVATNNIITITGTTYSFTNSGTTYTGTIEGPAYYLGGVAGDMGVYNGSFTVDKTDEIECYVVVTARDSSNNSLVLRGTVRGTADNLAFTGLLTGSGDAATGTSTVVLNSNSYTEPNEKNYAIASGSSLYITYTDDGTTYTATTTNTLEWIGPLEFTQVTDTGGAIESLVGIVPLLMIVGVIITILGMVVLRT